MNPFKPLIAATALFLAGLGIAPTAEAAKPTPGIHVVKREYSRNFELAPGEETLVASLCLAGEVAIGGSVTGYSPNAKQVLSHHFGDETRSGWAIWYRNDTAETIQVYAATGALCTAGTLTFGQSG